MNTEFLCNYFLYVPGSSNAVELRWPSRAKYHNLTLSQNRT